MVEKHLHLSRKRSSSLARKRGDLCWIRQESHHRFIELGAAQVLAIKAGLAIPWNKLRLLRRYVTSCIKGTNSSSLLFQVAQIVRHLSGW